MRSESSHLIVDGYAATTDELAELLRDAGHVVEMETPQAGYERRLLAHQLVGVVEQLPLGIYHVDTDWVLTYVNAEAVAILGFSAEDLVGRTLYEIFPDLPGTFPDRMSRQAIESRKAVDFVNFYEPMGTWFEVTVFPTPNGHLTVFKDVTDLQDTNRLMRLQSAALDAAANAIVITDRDGIIQWFNPAFATSYGYAKEEVLGHNPGEVIRSHIHDDAFYDAMWQTILRGDVWQGEIINRRKDGALVYEEMTITPVVDENGDITNFVAIKQDIGARKESERLIRRQADLIERSSDAIVVCDLDGTVLFWNKGAEIQFGWSKSEAEGQLARDVPFWNAARYSEAMETTRRDGEWSAELELIDRNGQPARCLARWTLVEEEGGNAILALYTDVSEQYALSRRIESAQRLESVGPLAGGIAHELNNMLAPVLMGVDMLSGSEQDASRVEVLESMRRSVERSARLVQQVLSVSRGVEGVRNAVSIGVLLHDVRSLVENALPSGVSLSVNIAGDVWTIVGDTDHIQQVILNLFSNAVDAMPDGGIISVDVENVDVDSQYAVSIQNARVGRFVCIQIHDNGSGMPDNVVEHIFEPFFTTKKVGEGTGLGLSTTIGLVHSLDGFMDVRSRVGVGSTFRVYLPAEPEDTEEQVLDSNVSGNGELIMVVDDDEEIRKITSATLESVGYRVLVAHDGADAIGKFALNRRDIALVITDLIMPVMDGPAFIQAVRALDPGARIAAWTGNKGAQRAVDVASLGVPYVLEKPIAGRDLLRVIKDMLGQVR